MSSDTKSPIVATGAAAKVAVQGGLFTRKALAEFPQQNHSADSLGEAEADDQHRYYIKGDVNALPVRASEWLCSRLAEAVGIATPAAAIIELLGGDLVFGSRRVIGVSDEVTTRSYLTTPTSGNSSAQIQGLQEILSGIYAFDMFVFNEDRHLGNYLSIDDSGQRRFFAFDFSRALFWRWPWPDFPEAYQNTRIFGGVLRGLHGFSETAAETVIDKLAAVPLTALEGAMNELPPGWLSANLQAEFIDWWKSADRSDRLSKLREGLKDGTLL